VGGVLSFVPARTDGGLDAYKFVVGGAITARVERFHFGGVLRLAHLTVNRATEASSFQTWTFGANARAIFDVVRFDPDGNGALYLYAEGSAELAGGILFGAAVGSGVRF
jgi:hypothetical protein